MVCFFTCTGFCVGGRQMGNRFNPVGVNPFIFSRFDVHRSQVYSAEIPLSFVRLNEHKKNAKARNTVSLAPPLVCRTN